jgi:hypothetical protein
VCIIGLWFLCYNNNKNAIIINLKEFHCRVGYHGTLFATSASSDGYETIFVWSHAAFSMCPNWSVRNDCNEAVHPSHRAHHRTKRSKSPWIFPNGGSEALLSRLRHNCRLDWADSDSWSRCLLTYLALQPVCSRRFFSIALYPELGPSVTIKKAFCGRSSSLLNAAVDTRAVELPLEFEVVSPPIHTVFLVHWPSILLCSFLFSAHVFACWISCRSLVVLIVARFSTTLTISVNNTSLV